MEPEINIDQIREVLKRKINDKKNVNCVENASEFYYLSGQIIYFFLSKDKRRLKQTQDISNFIKCKNLQKLRQKIMKFYLQICGCIPQNNYKFNNAYSLVTNYIENAPMDGVVFISGFTSLNLM